MTSSDTDLADVDFFTDEAVAARAEPYFDHMLAEHPVYRDPRYGVVIVTGYEDALQVYLQPDVYSSINRTGGPVVDLPFSVRSDDISELLEKNRGFFGANDQIVTFDPPVHTAHRTVLMGLITPKRLKENEAFLKRTADTILDRLLPAGRFDFIWDYAKGYTILAVADLLGVPVEDHPMLIDVLASSPAPVLGNLELQAATHNTIEKLYDYFIAKIEERRAHPRTDVLTGLALATFPDGSLPEPIEVARIAANLFSAGQETTVQLLGITLQRIAEDAELQERLRQDFTLIPKFIEETLRIEPPIKGSFRLVKKPTTLGGLELSPGTNVMLLHGAAGRDPRVFEDPGTFIAERPNARQHLAFGRGIHTCPGAPLARAEAVFSIQRLLQRTSSIRVSEEHHGTPEDRHWNLIRSYKFRGHTELHLEVTEAE
ncbi:cytochrome P450 [Rathayibacter sp. VKM Ac-2835]|uniref:cytochrome P450 n=1 Tax=Rathayibacter sp. VKM Ac-2835 TaxID=2739043 RepID=UPI00156415B3|nr:cytochrome P450 [Rathayibacter sp. VKM Ac-2835]NRG41047.1 cytochrome P450 [Rathayibacter sp. VKM Ac-2835]